MRTDIHATVLALGPDSRLYTAYGYRAVGAGQGDIGFNGQRFERLTGCYLLGNGYRSYSPALLRFQSPDSLSPFGDGGINAYAYCQGDPVNSEDPSGHFRLFSRIARLLVSKVPKQPVPMRQAGGVSRTLAQGLPLGARPFQLQPASGGIVAFYKRQDLMAGIAHRSKLNRSGHGASPIEIPQERRVLSPSALTQLAPKLRKQELRNPGYQVRRGFVHSAVRFPGARVPVATQRHGVRNL